MANEFYLYREPSTLVDTPGTLFLNDTQICYTLEDLDRGLRSDMTVKEIQAIKVYGQTAIPYGRYELKWWDSVKFGRVPQLLNVKGFSYILIHSGNDNLQTSGCILTGLQRGQNQVLQSREAMKKVKRLIYEHDIKFINILSEYGHT